MRYNRDEIRKKPKLNKTSTKTLKDLEDWELANGPGKLCIAFDLTRSNSDRIDLSNSDFMWLEDCGQSSTFEVDVSKRIGIDSTPIESRNQLWRFCVKDNFCVSTAKPGYIRKQMKLQKNGESL